MDLYQSLRALKREGIEGGTARLPDGEFYVWVGDTARAIFDSGVFHTREEATRWLARAVTRNFPRSELARVRSFVMQMTRGLQPDGAP